MQHTFWNEMKWTCWQAVVASSKQQNRIESNKYYVTHWYFGAQLLSGFFVLFFLFQCFKGFDLFFLLLQISSLEFNAMLDYSVNNFLGCHGISWMKWRKWKTALESAFWQSAKNSREKRNCYLNQRKWICPSSLVQHMDPELHFPMATQFDRGIQRSHWNDSWALWWRNMVHRLQPRSRTWKWKKKRKNKIINTFISDCIPLIMNAIVHISKWAD